MVRILNEYYSFDQAKCLVEGGGIGEAGKPKDLYMRGIFVQGGIKNHNQRVYPVREIAKAVEGSNHVR
jgi:hypothetical protein